MNSINLIRAAQVGVVAVAADLIFNQGRTVTGVTVGVIGNLGLQFCKAVKERMVKNGYRIASPKNLSLEDHEEALKKALARIQAEHPLSYDRYLLSHDLKNEVEALHHFKSSLEEGVCYGHATVLFKSIHPFSLQQNLSSMTAEDVYYHQIVQSLRVDASFCLKNIDLVLKLEEIEQRLKALAGESPKKLEPKAVQVQKYQEELDHIKMDDPISTFSSSSGFAVQAPPEIYQRIFDKSLDKAGISKKADIIGVIGLPRHVLAFHYGPKGYFLYDPFNSDKGLFQYPDKATFFQSLREHALYDVQRSKYALVEKDKADSSPEEILQDTDILVWQAEVRYRFKAL